MTTQSTKAYFDESNTKSRVSHRKMCLLGLEREQNGLTYKQLAAKIGLKPEQVWKRLSELHTENMIAIAGTTDTYSRYKLVREPGLFPVEKKPTFTDWAKQNEPEIWRKYRVLIWHEL